MQPTNLIFICSDEHSRERLGCYGDPYAITPNLDRLAQEGTLFENAYSNNPICVPARASFITGRYSHETSNWDNGHPYDGTVKGFGHALQDNDISFTTIGKLHYKSAECDLGLPDQRIPLHVRNGVGDVLGSARVPGFVKTKQYEILKDAHIGNSDYTKYDENITKLALEYLQNETEPKEKPWVLYLGYVNPHFPFICPQKYYDMYEGVELPDPKQFAKDERPQHPVLESLRQYPSCHNATLEEARNAIRHYYGLVSFLDAQVGQIMDAVKQLGLSENTRIIYTSDHGDMLGDHGMFYKGCMYEGSVGVPFMMSGAGIQANRRMRTPISLIDLYPTILDCVSAKDTIPTVKHGTSLFEIMEQGEQYDRAVFSEFHTGAITDEFMNRKGQYKFIYYPGYTPHLFDLDNDSNELHNLAGDARYAEVLDMMEAELRKICNPEKVFAQCRAEQLAFVEAHGGMPKVLGDTNYVAYSPPPEM